MYIFIYFIYDQYEEYSKVLNKGLLLLSILDNTISKRNIKKHRDFSTHGFF